VTALTEEVLTDTFTDELPNVITLVLATKPLEEAPIVPILNEPDAFTDPVKVAPPSPVIRPEELIVLEYTSQRLVAVPMLEFVVLDNGTIVCVPPVINTPLLFTTCVNLFTRVSPETVGPLDTSMN